jgi:regulator of protease activity HflC (stomatin/prohibitin superfamily)
MNSQGEKTEQNPAFEEKIAPHRSGMAVLSLGILLLLAFAACIGVAAAFMGERPNAPGVAVIVAAAFGLLIDFVLLSGLMSLKPNEAAVFTLFGRYYGVLRSPGFYWLNPFARAFSSPRDAALTTGEISAPNSAGGAASKRISLKSLTLNNSKQKINDLLGNPVEIGIVVIWRVVNTALAVFNVDNYKEYLSIQCDSALRNIVSQYPYDMSGGEEHERSLRGSRHEIASRLRDEIQNNVRLAGLEIIEARITHLAYAPEIAAVMLQRQQAAAIIDARQMIVEGAVGMVEMALTRISENGIVELDEERKAAMVSNLLVVLCGSKDAQPIVNSGSLY